MSIQSVLVIGSGTMGHGIAHVAAQAGVQAYLYDVDADLVEAGLAKVKANLQKGVDRGKVTQEAMDAALANLAAAPADLAEAAAGMDLVVEAVPERMELKQAIFQTLGALTGQPAPTVKVPHWLPPGWAALDTGFFVSPELSESIRPLDVYPGVL